MQFQENNLIQTQENGEKPHFGPDLSQLSPNSCHVWLLQSLDIMISYQHVKYQKKATDPFLRKLSDGQMDRQTDGQE